MQLTNVALTTLALALGASAVPVPNPLVRGSSDIVARSSFLDAVKKLLADAPNLANINPSLFGAREPTAGESGLNTRSPESLLETLLAFGQSTPDFDSSQLQTREPTAQESRVNARSPGGLFGEIVGVLPPPHFYGLDPTGIVQDRAPAQARGDYGTTPTAQESRVNARAPGGLFGDIIGLSPPPFFSGVDPSRFLQTRAPGTPAQARGDYGYALRPFNSAAALRAEERCRRCARRTTPAVGDADLATILQVLAAGTSNVDARMDLESVLESISKREVNELE